MAIYKSDMVDIELSSGNIHRSFLGHTIGNGDVLANRFGIRAFREKEPETLTGNCTGYFVRNGTGETVVISDGVVSGNEAYVTLPAACYAVNGQFSLAIKVSNGTETVTMRIVDGVVDMTNTSTPVDPGELIPSIEDLLDAIEAAVESIPADYSDLWESLAPNFATNRHYNVGQYVTYDGAVYRFKKDHNFGSWDATEVDEISMGTDVANILSNITEYNADNLWTIGDWDVPANPGYCNLQEYMKELVLPAGTYTFSGMITTEETEDNYVRLSFGVGGSTQYVNLDGNTGFRTSKTATFESEATLNRIQSGPSVSASMNNAATLHDMQIVAGSEAGDYFPALTAKDYLARQNCAMISLCDKQNELGIWGGDLLDAKKGYSANDGNSGLYYYTFAKLYPAGVYTVIYNIDSSDANSPTIRFSRSTSGYTVISSATQNITLGKTVSITFNIDEPWGMLWLFAGTNTSDSAGRSLTINRLDIYNGAYIDKDNGVDVTKSIEGALTLLGSCDLGKGVYTVDGLEMPDGSQIRGATGTVINLPAFSGSAEADLPELSGDTYGNWVTTSYNLLPGLYTFTINMESTYTGTSSRVVFCSEENYHSSNIVADVTVERNAEHTYTIYAKKQIKSIFVFGGLNTQTTCTFTVHTMEVEQTGHAAIIMNGNDCTIQDVTIRGSATAITPGATPGGQVGILWCNPDIRHGTITRCRLQDLDNSGILAYGTGYPTDHGLIISDCFISNNCIGINIKYNCEFNKISNCIITGNYYGVINRGGNNIVDSCGIDANIYGMLVNNDEGGNNGHGSISNCTFNHSNSNEGYGLIVKGTGRMLIENCNVYYSKIRFENTNGNILSNCGFGNSAPIEIVGGQCTLIIGCMMLSADANPITLQNNTAAKVINCFTRSGAEVTPTVA